MGGNEPDPHEQRRSCGAPGNVVVHGYLAVDPAVLHRLLNEGLGDFAEFARHVERYLGA